MFNKENYTFVIDEKGGETAVLESNDGKSSVEYIKFNKEKIVDYYNNIIPLCKLLKSHATNIMLLKNNLVLIHPLMKGVRSYMIINDNKINYDYYTNSLIGLVDITSVNTKFRKTKSGVYGSVGSEPDTYSIIVAASEDNFIEIPVYTNDATINSVINATYISLPHWNFSDKDEILSDDISGFTRIPTSVIYDMNEKRLCEVVIDDYIVLLSKPFLGNLKDTTALYYKIVDETDDKICVKFRQEEELGNIYTYAAFIKVRKEEGI